jgi:hypothetical protein
VAAGAPKYRFSSVWGISPQAFIPNCLYRGKGIRIRANLIPKGILSGKRDKTQAEIYPKSSYREKRDKKQAKKLSQIKNISDLG